MLLSFIEGLVSCYNGNKYFYPLHKAKKLKIVDFLAKKPKMWKNQDNFVTFNFEISALDNKMYALPGLVALIFILLLIVITTLAYSLRRTMEFGVRLMPFIQLGGNFCHSKSADFDHFLTHKNPGILLILSPIPF